MTDQQQQQPDPGDEPQRPSQPPRVPRIWILKRGGLRVAGDDGTTIEIGLMPREMRALARLLHAQAGLIDGWQPSRIGREPIDE